MCEVDGFSIFIQSARRPIALVISETVLDADNDPANEVWLALIRLTVMLWLKWRKQCDNKHIEWNIPKIGEDDTKAQRDEEQQRRTGRTASRSLAVSISSG